jgi:hypothetical protein
MKSTKGETAQKWGLRAQVVLWRLLTPELFFWPLWSMLGWGIGLTFHIWAVYSPSTLNARREWVNLPPALVYYCRRPHARLST